MSERTDEELIKIVTVERDKYNPIALEAADAEVEKRNIDTVTFETNSALALTQKIYKQRWLEWMERKRWIRPLSCRPFASSFLWTDYHFYVRSREIMVSSRKERLLRVKRC